MIAARRRRVAPRAAGFDLEARHPDRAWLTGCAGKARYTSEAAAWTGAGLQFGPPLDVYRCASCDGYHLTSVRPAGQRKAARPVNILAFVCSACHARHAAIAASAEPWTPARRRVALLELEPVAIADGWSIGFEDHCPACAAALGLETYRGVP